MTTKQLAKQLGLIRRSSKLSRNAKGSHRPKAKQYFEYLIIIDFESTCWKDAKHYGQEIIEFPAVLLNTANGAVESEFHTYVQPQEHPILSDFCTELTGIKQQQVDDGVPLKICLSQFSSWIQKLQSEKSIIFPTVLPTPSSSEQKMCGFVTWSDWDLGVCLLYECRRKQLRKPDILNSWIDLRLTYKLFYNRKPKGLNGALQDVGIEFSGREHSGLDDSRNTARLAWRMICDGSVMKITKSLDKVPPKIPLEKAKMVVPVQDQDDGSGALIVTVVEDDQQSINRNTNSTSPDVMQALKTQHPLSTGNRNKIVRAQEEKSGTEQVLQTQTLINGLSTTLGNANKYRFSALNSCSSLPNGMQYGALASTSMVHSPHSQGQILIPTTVMSVNDVSALDVGSSSDLSILADWEEAAVLEDSQNESIGFSEEPNLVAVDSPSTSLLMFKKDQENCSVFPPIKLIGHQPAAPQSNSVIYKGPDTTIYNVDMKRPRCNGSAFKLPSALGNRSNINASSAGQTRRISTVLDHFPKRKLSSVSFHSPPKKLPFTIHEDRCNRFLPVTRNSSRVVPSAVLNSTVNLNTTIRAMKTGHITAPMCNCGRRAKKCTVSNVGPNQGRVFYGCSVRKRYDENGKGCKYFKWEDTLLKEKTANASVLLSTTGMSSSNTSYISMSSNAAHKPFFNLRPSMRT